MIKGLGYVQGMCWNFVLNDPKNKKHTKYSPHKHLQGNHLEKKLLFQPLLLQVLCGVCRMPTECMVRDLPTRLGSFRVECLGMILFGQSSCHTHVDQVQDLLRICESIFSTNILCTFC